MSAQPLNVPPGQSVNWAKVAFLFGAAITVLGWMWFGAQAAQRLTVLEERTQPLANGDLVIVQRDVSWIRQRLEEERP